MKLYANQSDYERFLKGKKILVTDRRIFEDDVECSSEVAERVQFLHVDTIYSCKVYEVRS